MAKAKAKSGAVADTAKERLQVARKVRDAMYEKLKALEISAENYLTWQKRYDDLAYAVTLTNGGDTVGVLTDQVAELKHVEQLVEELRRAGRVKEVDVQIARFYRLEAEEVLASEKGEGERVRRK